MDLSFLPVDLIRYISSFVHKLSWRIEIHYATLAAFRDSRTFDNLPSSAKTKYIQECDDAYVYGLDPFRRIRILKTNTIDVNEMKRKIVEAYIHPITAYLNCYRKCLVEMYWRPHCSFHLFGVHVHGEIPPEQYQLLLKSEGQRVGIYFDWQGCASYDMYRWRSIRSLIRW